MVADLLQPHQRRQHDALALDPFGILQRLGQIGHRLLVEGRLLAAERTIGLISVLSGRSAMTDLSVFIRRRM